VHVHRGSGRIAGGTIVAAHAGELIGQLTLLLNERLSLKTISRMVPCYPTQASADARVAYERRRSRLAARIGNPARLAELIGAESGLFQHKDTKGGHGPSTTFAGRCA
jgi:hypothetical protein